MCCVWKDQSRKQVQLESWNWTFCGSFYESSGPGLWSLCPCALEGCQKSSRCQHFSHRLSSLASWGACSNQLINLAIQISDVDTSVQATVMAMTSVLGLWGHWKLCAVSSWTARLSAWTWCRESTTGSTCRQAFVGNFLQNELFMWIFLRRKRYETNFTWIYSASDGFVRFSKSSAACSTAWFAFTSFGRGLWTKFATFFFESFINMQHHAAWYTDTYRPFGTWTETNWQGSHRVFVTGYVTQGTFTQAQAVLSPSSKVIER